MSLTGYWVTFNGPHFSFLLSFPPFVCYIFFRLVLLCRFIYCNLTFFWCTSRPGYDVDSPITFLTHGLHYPFISPMGLDTPSYTLGLCTL
jgi:hypothetical protein